jgi:hypothetical protein
MCESAGLRKACKTAFLSFGPCIRVVRGRQLNLRLQHKATGVHQLILLFLAVVLCAGACQAQNPDATDTAPPATTAPPTPPPRPQYFAGTITAITDDQITVSRTLVGHPTDTRSFQITPKTKLNRANCRLNTKVTVRYQHLPEGNIALQVLIHSASKPAVAAKPFLSL